MPSAGQSFGCSVDVGIDKGSVESLSIVCQSGINCHQYHQNKSEIKTEYPAIASTDEHP